MPPSDAPNVLVVMTDDHGEWCLGATGNRAVDTPTLDHLADTGVRMANGFTPSPVCSPARASFFTGLLPSQHGVHDWIRIDSEHDGPDWLAAETTLPELLGDAGYETGLAGKWHCGRGHEARVFDYAANMHAADWERPKFSVQRDREIAGRAVDFLRSERDPDAPFFLFVGLTATHGSWEGEPERLVDRHRGGDFPDVPDEETYRFGRTDVIDWIDDEDEARAQYYAAVEGIDEQVGRLVDELDRQGELADTLVVYTADHGHNCGHHGLWGKGNGTVPANMLEESIRVPLIVGGHEDLLGGRVRPEFVDHCDTFRTLLDAAGVDAPDERAYPGESYWPQLVRGAASTDRPQRQVCEYGDTWMARSERYKLVRRYGEGGDLLFDLDADPRETRNVIDDPAHADAVATLDEAIEETYERYADPERAGRDVSALPAYSGGREVWNR